MKLNPALEFKLLLTAIENLGIYPKSSPNGKRTEYQEGWNACIIQIGDNEEKIEEWWKSQQKKEELEKLLTDNIIDICIYQDQIILEVNCNDIFYWGVADAETITIEDLPDLLDCLKKVKHGKILWVAKKRKMRPQGAVYRDILLKEEWPLFDECGPSRETEFGNPIKR